MKIDFADIVLLNAELKKRNTRYHVTYKDENTACIEPPGECCLTDDLKTCYGVHQRLLQAERRAGSFF